MATRVFLKDVGRFKKGDIREYPYPTWQGLEKSAKMALEKFSKPVDDAVRDSIQSGAGNDGLMRRSKS